MILNGKNRISSLIIEINGDFTISWFNVAFLSFICGFN